MNLIPGSNPPSSVDPLSTRPALSSSLSHLARKSAQVSFDGECFPLCQYVSQGLIATSLHESLGVHAICRSEDEFQPYFVPIIHMLHLVLVIPLQWMHRIKNPHAEAHLPLGLYCNQSGTRQYHNLET